MPKDISFLVPGGALKGAFDAKILNSMEENDELLLAGARCGPFEVAELIGKGGFGAVYRAVRVEGEFGQTVALKVVRAREELRDAFKKERQILSALFHPGIARIIDGGETPDGRLWFALDYIEGLLLNKYIQTSMPSWQQLVSIFRQVSETIHFAHQHLVIHGDIKPSNIIINHADFPVLLDFGIAKRTDEKQHTNTAAFTQKYASPEQIVGAPLTIASDIFQLGRLMQTVSQKYEVFARMPTWKTKAFAKIIDKATHVVAEKRYSSAALLAEDLNALTTNYAPSVCRSPWNTLLFYCARHFIAVPMTLLAGAIFSILLITSVIEIQRQRDLAMINEARAQEEARRANIATSRYQNTNEFVLSLFSAADPGEDRGNDITAKQLLQRGTHRLLSSQWGSNFTNYSVATEIARVSVELGETQSATNLLQAVAKHGPPRLVEESLPYAEMLILLVQVYGLSGRYQDALNTINNCKDAINLLPKQQDKARLEANLKAQASRVHLLMGNSVLAYTLIRESVLAFEDFESNRTLGYADAATYYSTILFERGEFSLAAHYRKMALDVFKEKLGEYSPKYINLLAKISVDYTRGKQFASAESAIQESIALQQMSFPENHRQMAIKLYFFSVLRYFERRYGESADLAADAVNEYKLAKGADPRSLSDIYQVLADAQMGLKNYEEAEKSLEMALSISKASGSQTGTADVQLTKSNLHIVRKQYDEAIKLLAEVRDTYSRTGDADSIRGTYLQLTELFLLESSSTDGIKNSKLACLPKTLIDRNEQLDPYYQDLLNSLKEQTEYGCKKL